VTVGLIPAPDIPEKVAADLASELPVLLGGRVDGGVSWEVPVVVGPLVVGPLVSSEKEAPEILGACRERKLREGWDLAICLTDLLPAHMGGRLVAEGGLRTPL
jgi:hypothetical protein